MSETVLQELDDHGVLLLTLNRPQRKNAFSNEQWQAFGDAIEAAGENPAVACVVVTGLPVKHKQLMYFIIVIPILLGFSLM